MLLLFRNRGGGGDFPPGFNPLTDYWWDGSDPSTMWQNTAKTTAVGAGNPVRVWTSKGVALDVVAPSDPARAPWNGTNELTFSGTEYYEATVTIPALCTWIVVAEVTISTGMITGGSNTERRRLFRQSVNLLRSETSNGRFDDVFQPSGKFVAQQITTANSLVLRSNTSEISAAVPPIIDATVLWMGEFPGYSTGVPPLQGTISSVYIKPNDAADATERAALETWFAAKYGVVLP